MDSRKNDPNPKPASAPTKGDEEKDRKKAEAAAPEEEREGAEDKHEQSVGEKSGDGEGDEEEFDKVSEFAPPRRSSRTPFTSLSQIDADLALARILQEQENAYQMLSRSGGWGSGGGGDLVGSEAGSEYDVDEDDSLGEGSAVDENDFDDDAYAQDPTADVDPSAFDDDESYARALQEAEERGLATRLMASAGIHDRVAEDTEDNGDNAQDTWSEVDPDELSFEELISLGEVVGTESRGLTNDVIAFLPSVSYKAQNTQEGSSDKCVVCQLDYEDGESLIVLSCKHVYHPECIKKWLQINKVCPICHAEVSASDS